VVDLHWEEVVMNQAEMGFWMSAFCAALTGGNAAHVAERFADDAVRCLRVRTADVPLAAAATATPPQAR
jgi:hypothetical protein